MPKYWQVNAMIDMIYNKKDIIILAGIRFNKSLPYQLILLIKDGAIVLIVLPNIALMTDQVCLSIIIFYCKF